MSEAKEEEMSVLLPPSLPAFAHAQTGRVWKPGGRAVSAAPWGREEGACSEVRWRRCCKGGGWEPSS